MQSVVLAAVGTVGKVTDSIAEMDVYSQENPVVNL